MSDDTTYVRWFDDLDADDTPQVGGKNSSLGEMISALKEKGIQVPDGFATTADAYRRYLEENEIEDEIRSLIDDFHSEDTSLEKAGEGIRSGWNLHNGKYALDDILNGEYPGYDGLKLKRRLIQNGYKEEKCEICGFDEARVTDGKVPLYLNHKNGDKSDHREENIELICWNCAHNVVGDEVLSEKRLMIY